MLFKRDDMLTSVMNWSAPTVTCMICSENILETNTPCWLILFFFYKHHIHVHVYRSVWKRKRERESRVLCMYALHAWWNVYICYELIVSDCHIHDMQRKYFRNQHSLLVDPFLLLQASHTCACISECVKEKERESSVGFKKYLYW